MAHNSPGFDSHFLKSVMHEMNVPYETTPSPGSIHNSLQLKIADLNIRFIDSWRFVIIPLEAFGKTFGLPQSKGEFPRQFSTEDHRERSGPLPPLDEEGEDYYDLRNRFGGSGVETLKTAKQKFIEWHEEESRKYTPFTSQPWVYKDKLLDYCWRDCEVLAAGLRQYRNLYLNPEDELDPTAD